MCDTMNSYVRYVSDFSRIPHEDRYYENVIFFIVFWNVAPLKIKIICDKCPATF